MKVTIFDKFYASLYLKVLINIVISSKKTVIYVEMLNNKGLLSSDEETFDTKYLSQEMIEYITNFTKETPFHYISILDRSTSQGVVPTCAKNNIGYYCDMSSSEYKCYEDSWTYYTSKTDIYEIEKVYEKVGIDLIFSPFIVLAHFFKDKIDSHPAMFLLVEDGAISLSIFHKSELLYGEHIDTSVDLVNDELLLDEVEIQDLDLDDKLDIDDSIDLDDIDSIDELDDFGDIADLDSFDEIEEFDETKDIEEELIENEEAEEYADSSSHSDGLNEDYQRFVLIQSAVNNFYKDEKFKSEFIENVYIADSIGLSPDMKKYLEEEMFLNVYIRHIDIAMKVCEIAKMELS